ncbi:MAG: hypothetical protein HMLKMBBP_00005 [Planctomycetes bacterium]|nr:hypothetical protein [Planctomycetota bacterium]
MRIAVVGSGISGLAAALVLSRAHDVVLFERDARLGGHSHTVDAALPGGTVPVDTGFIVFNERTYPGFTKLLSILGVASQESEMSFSVREERPGRPELEFNGTSLNALFAQRRNLARPSFLRMVRDILRWNREARALLDDGPETTFGEFLSRGSWSREFREHFLRPMCAAIWSSPEGGVDALPARLFTRFFENHGMLSVDDRPVWRTVTGGSRTYVNAIAARLGDRLRTSSRVVRVARADDHVEVTVEGRGAERFDHAVLAAHADQSLALLADADASERAALSAFPYRANDTVLHTDARMLPRRPLARAAWNYHLLPGPPPRPAVTYDLTRLQRLPSPAGARLLVTLNRTGDLDPASVLGRWEYEHPAYAVGSPAAQREIGRINGTRRTWFCGAWWRWGFHEDGLQSALAVTRGFGLEL